MLDGRAQGWERIHGHLVDHRRFGGVGFGHEQAPRSSGLRRFRDGQDSGYGPERTIERKFAYREMVPRGFLPQLSGGDQDS
jgi:hypothetical protein